MFVFQSYFQASYRCQAVIYASPAMCQSATSVKVKVTSGFLASDVTNRTGCGSEHAPWVLEALPGQRINITLLDFAVEKTRGVNECLR